MLDVAAKVAPCTYVLDKVSHLKARLEQFSPRSDYRLLVGREAINAILQTAIGIKMVASSIEAEAEKTEALHKMWENYPFYIPTDQHKYFLELCDMPAIVRWDIQPDIIIFLRDGFPCGAVTVGG